MITTPKLVCAKSSTPKLMTRRQKIPERCAWTVIPVRSVTGAFRNIDRNTRALAYGSTAHDVCRDHGDVTRRLVTENFLCALGDGSSLKPATKKGGNGTGNWGRCARELSEQLTESGCRVSLAYQDNIRKRVLFRHATDDIVGACLHRDTEFYFM